MNPTHPHPRSAGKTLHVGVKAPLSAVTPGQTMVIYEGTHVLTQTTIDRVDRIA
ncbi:aminomethyltransferase beta-barrel domain-containing protein [uncultured Tessaracoccus sp.]|uniref:aminomethyltransferase beta-barrel domain-containing protein n=1 Tax=uncultured Tessaracoccus sp. TaxID=905023 RepID=UPI00343D3B81